MSNMNRFHLIFDGFENGCFNAVSVFPHGDVSEHHDSTQQESSRIGLVLSCYVRGRTMYLEGEQEEVMWI